VPILKEFSRREQRQCLASKPASDFPYPKSILELPLATSNQVIEKSATSHPCRTLCRLLLLLPPPPVPITSASLSAAYRPSLITVVSTLKVLSTSTQLIVVLPCPAVHAQLQAPRCQIYTELQRSLAGLYSLGVHRVRQSWCLMWSPILLDL